MKRITNFVWLLYLIPLIGQTQSLSSLPALGKQYMVSNLHPCHGQVVSFNQIMWPNGMTPSSWNWTITPSAYTFVNGTTSSSQNPQILFNDGGTYQVQLIEEDMLGGSNTSVTITVDEVATLPFNENFEGPEVIPPGFDHISNDHLPYSAWGLPIGDKSFEKRLATGNSGSSGGCLGINHYYYAYAGMESDYTDTTFYHELLSTGSIDLTGTSSPLLTFKKSYKSNSMLWFYPYKKDYLKIYISTDCGDTWNLPVYFKKGDQLSNYTDYSAPYSPQNSDDWDIDSVDLSAYIGQQIRVKFVVGNKRGQNFYFDDISIFDQSVSAVHVNINSDQVNNSICEGTTITFSASTSNYEGVASYQWFVNGEYVASGGSYGSASLQDESVVNCILLNVGNQAIATSNAICINVNSPNNTSPSILIEAPTETICDGTPVQITPVTTNAGQIPNFAWFVNGQASGNSEIFVSTSLQDGDQIHCIMESSEACLSNQFATSNTITMSITPNHIPSITITSNLSNPICFGQSLILTANTGDVGSTPSYEWLVNGFLVGAQSTCTSSSLADNDVISCTVYTSDNTCVSSSSATAEYTVQVNPLVTPSISITADSDTICENSEVLFSSTVVNGGLTPTYNWFVNGVSVGSNATYSSTTLQDNAIVSCVLNSSASCVSSVTATSNQIVIVVTSTPAVPTITYSNGILSSGSAIGNQWYYNSELIPGATGQTCIPDENGTYTVVVSINDCLAFGSFEYTYAGLAEFDLTDFEIYPNPTTAIVNIQIPASWNSNNIIDLKVMNLIGEKYTVPITGGGNFRSVDLSALPASVYLIKISMERNEIVTKVVKNQ